MKSCPHCGHVGEDGVCAHCGQPLPPEEPDLQLPPGTLLSGTHGTYRLDRVLGQGGFGITYAAFHPEQNRMTAVKEYFPVRCTLRNPDRTVIPKPGREEEYQAGLDSFSREAQMLAALGNFPSVVQVLDCFQANGTAYLVMEYLDGVPLHQKAAQLGGRIPPEELFPKLPALLRDLEAIHQLGVLHRDITPDNIMWMPDGTLKLLDFGSARTMGGNKSMTVMLKLGFAPVEQYLTHGQGPYTDVYALCATIYYLLTGVSPMDAVDRLEEDRLRSPIELGAALTPEESEALLHGMAIQPKKRTQTAAALAEELFPHGPPAPRTVSSSAPPAGSSVLDRLANWLRRLWKG